MLECAATCDLRNVEELVQVQHCCPNGNSEGASSRQGICDSYSAKDCEESCGLSSILAQLRYSREQEKRAGGPRFAAGVATGFRP